MPRASIRKIHLYPLAIPLKRKVSHASHQRVIADPVVCAVEMADGAIGYGETLPRPYVTGEKVDSVLDTIEQVYMPWMLDFGPESFLEAVELIDSLPMTDQDGIPVPAARAAVELALLDGCSRFFQRSIADITGWFELKGFGSPGSSRSIRFSGVLAGSTIQSTMKTLRLLWWYGVRDFKLKVGLEDDSDRIAEVLRFLEKPIRKGRASLRLDANGGWSKDDALFRFDEWKDLPIESIEQPLPKGQEEALPALKAVSPVPIMHDESLCLASDAERLHHLGVDDAYNIRLSKCGGLIPSLKLAAYARRFDKIIQLGCMVGETSILSAAGLCFLNMVPRVRFAEGCFGSFLLREDVIPRGLRFGYGGRLPKTREFGWGINVASDQLEKLSPDGPRSQIF